MSIISWNIIRFVVLSKRILLFNINRTVLQYIKLQRKQDAVNLLTAHRHSDTHCPLDNTQ